MPWTGGSFSRTDGQRNGTSVWQQAKAALVGILATAHDTHDQDLAGGINATLCKDGSNSPTQNLPMNGNKHTGAAAATASGQYMRYDEVNGVYQPVNANLSAAAALTIAANQIALGIGPNAFSMISFTPTAQTLAAITTLPGVKGALEVNQAVTAASATLAIDMLLGWNVALTLSNTVTTFTVSNWPPAGKMGKLWLEIASTGAFNITGWPGSSRVWTGGVAPTITSGAGKKDTIALTSSDGGSTFRGYVVSQNMA